MKIAVIVQARMGSTRLPGKVLAKVLGKPLLEYLIERLKRTVGMDQLVIATSREKADDAIEDLCVQLGVDCYRGSENDVLDRYYQAAKKIRAHIIVRITGDCPLMDPALISTLLGIVIDHPDQIDYMSNTLWRSYPRGMDVEVFSFKALREAAKNATEPAEREHVTQYMLKNISHQRMTNYLNGMGNSSDLRLTVDTPEDFELIRRIIETLYPIKPDFGLFDILSLIDKNPKWREINAHIEQKKP